MVTLAPIDERRIRLTVGSSTRNERETRISVRNLNVYYGAFHAVRNVTMQVPDCSITAIIGPSGCGKSTVLRCFNRMNDLVPNARVEGQILLDDEDILQTLDVVRVRRRVGMVFQRPNPFPKSIFDNVAYGPRMHGAATRQLPEIVEHSLRAAALWTEVKDKLNQSALGLSGGQQQRLCIARCLAMQPSVVLMDEPCSALDPIATQRIEELLCDLKDKYTIVIVTHNMQQAARVSDVTAVFMLGEDRAGELAEIGPTQQVFTRPKDPRTDLYVTGRVG